MAATALVPERAVRRRLVRVAEYQLRSAQVEDCAELIEEPVILLENGQPKIVYLHLAGQEDLSGLVGLLRKVRYDTTERTRGLLSTSRVFGYEPRKMMRKEYCSMTSLRLDAPQAFGALQQTAEIVERYYAATNPVLYGQHRELARNKVRSEWRMSTVFTSGIVNFNNPLPYHFDRGNFAKVWSAMLVFKGAGVEGGELAVPEYDLRFALPDHSLFMFDGQALLHGVTPIRKTQADSYRLSVVYYSLRGMWQCLAPGAELARIRKVRTQRERKRGGLP